MTDEEKRMTMTHLSVNLNKLALLRNQRDIGYPDLLDHATIILDAGAHGLTIHPRPDERHIRFSDITPLSNFIKKWNAKNKSNIEFNIEGYPSDDFINRVITHNCDQVTLVPDEPNQKTSDHGWNVQTKADFLKPIVQKLKENGRRVSLFLDPTPEDVEICAAIGIDRIELYTGPFATNDIDVDQYAKTAQMAKKLNIEVNAGHDLCLDNLGLFITKVPECTEVSIGHAITADALKMGWHGAVIAYLTAIEFGHKNVQLNQTPSIEKS